MTEEPDKKIASFIGVLISAYYLPYLAFGLRLASVLEFCFVIGSISSCLWDIRWVLVRSTSSIYAFICLIFYYNHKVHKIEKLYQVNDDGDLKS